MTDIVLTPDAARALAAATLERSRTAPDNARAVADGLIAAELVGQGGHGLRRVAAYAAQAASGKVDGFAVPTITRTRPGALAVDAANGFAYPALRQLFAPLADAVRAQGIAIAGIRRSHHCGVAGAVVEPYADAGLVALLFANTPGAMAPWGARKALFGTNPIAFAAPVANADPIVVDVSLSKVARGKIMAASQKHEPIPPDWAFDADGNPTADPDAALAGTMAPLGDAKGTVLALMVELLAAGLTGANYANEANSFFDASGKPPGVGQTLIVIDPALFGATTVLDRFAEMAFMVEAAAGARLAGRRRQAMRRKLRDQGIVADAALVAQIEAIGR